MSKNSYGAAVSELQTGRSKPNHRTQHKGGRVRAKTDLLVQAAVAWARARDTLTQTELLAAAWNLARELDAE